MPGLRASARLLLVIVLAGGTGVLGTLAVAPAASADGCPGHPGAIGTSRVLVLQSGDPARIGSMQYRQSLPLAEKEVVLTFDDGPQPRYSNRVLDILAAQCVKATYFLIGAMAREHPSVVRRIFEEGHSIGTHSEDHPIGMEKMPPEKVRQEIDDGIADVAAALGDPADLAPFFRIPGLERSAVIEEELAARSLLVFSADVVADDWHRRIKPKQIVERAMKRLQARGKGILLLHDIHPATVAALPDLLVKLQQAGFRIVHVVPATTEPIEMAGASGQRLPIWPPVGPIRVENRIALAAPDANSFAADYRPGHRILVADASANAGYLALSVGAAWNEPAVPALAKAEAELPAPDISDIGPLLLSLPAGAAKLGASMSLLLAGTSRQADAAVPLTATSPLE
jgi:peptidoglycan/xylan/chitin deacetylase (PgdA/CDA1 family)